MHVVLKICVRIKHGVHGMFPQEKYEDSSLRLHKVAPESILHHSSRFMNTCIRM